MQQIEPNVTDNPFSLSNIRTINSNGENQSVKNSKINDEELNNDGEIYSQKDDNSYSDDDDMSSTSFVSDTDE